MEIGPVEVVRLTEIVRIRRAVARGRPQQYVESDHFDSNRGFRIFNYGANWRADIRRCLWCSNPRLPGQSMCILCREKNNARSRNPNLIRSRFVLKCGDGYLRRYQLSAGITEKCVTDVAKATIYKTNFNALKRLVALVQAGGVGWEVVDLEVG